MKAKSPKLLEVLFEVKKAGKADGAKAEGLADDISILLGKGSIFK
jgi:hypothetical protein